jgi:hypothetical protein
MTAKEKAEELMLFFYDLIGVWSKAEKCALKAIDEILWEIIKYADNSREYVVENSDYWEDVKYEIKQL